MCLAIILAPVPFIKALVDNLKLVNGFILQNDGLCGPCLPHSPGDCLVTRTLRNAGTEVVVGVENACDESMNHGLWT